jgi:CheY-like chemotaxis protein
MKQTSLIVDDERCIRVELKGLLSREGYELALAENGAEALQVLASQPFDLMLTDLRMPHIDE